VRDRDLLGHVILLNFQMVRRRSEDLPCLARRLPLQRGHVNLDDEMSAGPHVPRRVSEMFDLSSWPVRLAMVLRRR
jgi:hypothetical protein